MGSYCEPKTEGIDATAGGLVWIRRRNGSWWPGQILGLDELPKSWSGSLRAGTPVRLLGREDGSMDWYNLEKSKRVKAFRCGEYDECIQKAKASSVHSSKTGPKAGKYVRREDAILHALEIEKSQYSSENQEFCLGINSSVVIMGDVGSGEEQEKTNTTEVRAAEKKRWKTPNDSEDDGTKGAKRMRGLQDLGLGMVSKRKQAKAIHLEGSRELVVTNSDSLSDSNIDNDFSSLSHVNSSKDSCTSLKRRRHQVPQVHENTKRKNRRRTLIQVLESTARVTVTSFSDQGGGPARLSLQQVKRNQYSAGESTESKKTDYSVVNNSSLDCSATSCEEASVGAYAKTSTAAAYDDTTCSEMKDNEPSGIVGIASNGRFEGFYDVPVVMEENISRDFSHELMIHTSKKLQSGAVERHSDFCRKVGPIPWAKEGLGENGSTSLTIQRQRKDEYIPKSHLSGKQILRSLSMKRSEDGFVGYDSKVDNGSSDESLDSDNGGQMVKYQSLCVDLGDESILQTFKHTDLAERKSVVDCSGHQVADSALYDVNLDVQASYQGPHVPLVSLMSKSSGQAVVGHPISVEVLQNGHCDTMMSSTNCRPITCSIYVSSFHASGIVDVPLLQYEDGGMVGKLHLRTMCTSPSHRKFQRKPSGWLTVHQSPPLKKSLKIKRSGSLLRKTRKLSSINVGYEHKIENKAVVEKLGRPVVSCVPLKLVFSRISEALSRPRPANHL